MEHAVHANSPFRFAEGIRVSGVHNVRGEGVPGGKGGRLPCALDPGGGARVGAAQALRGRAGELPPGVLHEVPRVNKSQALFESNPFHSTSLDSTPF